MGTRRARMYIIAGSVAISVGFPSSLPAIASEGEPSAAPVVSPGPSAEPSEPASASPDPSVSPTASPASEAPPAGEEAAADEAGTARRDRSRRRARAGVSAVDDRFQSATITVDAGDEVVWTNDGQNPHTVTSDDGSFDSGTLDNGESFSATLDEAGSFAYYCEFHGGSGGVGMSGVVVVRAAGDPAPPADGAGEVARTGWGLFPLAIGGLALVVVGLLSVLAGRRASG